MFYTLLGNYSLVFGFIFSLIIFFFCFKSINYKSEKIETNIFSFLFLQFLSISLSFICLIISFVLSDFSNETVYNNSHTTKPLFYKISGAWGNHEGSLLLWLLVLVFFVFIFSLTSKKHPKKYRILTIVFQEIIIFGFISFLLITSNPFNIIFPIPIEGLGLNPILQDPALAIHPPILYLGYVGSSIIFSSSLAALTQNYVNKSWASHIKKWIISSWIFLTLGILVGSIWAYYELGWGGFWFWDAVENISLMPWFCLTALLHTILVLEKRNLLKTWTLILSITTFTLSVSGTFLVRSGILNSVHTFANDPSRGIFILIFLFILIILSIVIFFFFQINDGPTIKKSFLLSKETSIMINNWFMMYFLSVVLIGTIYPIILEVLSDNRVSIGPPFYNKLLYPFLILFLIIMAFGTKLNWINSTLPKFRYINFFYLFISILISIYIVEITETKYLFSTALFGASFILIIKATEDFFVKNNNFSQNLSHFAFSIFILSILLNGVLSREFSANMKYGDEIKINESSIKFINLETINGKNYKSIITGFQIIDKNGKIENFNPEIRIFNQPEILTSEADIKSDIFSDKFLVVNLLKDDGYFNVRYQIKPFMLWIWTSIVLLSIGGMLSFFRRV